MDATQLEPHKWYWIRRRDGSLAPYRYYQTRKDPRTGRLLADFYVGSMLQTWPVSHVVSEARMPQVGVTHE